MEEKPVIKNIFIDGGGVYGYAICGCLVELEKQGLLQNIENILGCSVGSIYGLYLSLGITAEEMTNLTFNIDVNSLVDIKKNNLINIYKYYGFENGKKFSNIVKNIIKYKTGNENFTFLELYEKYKKNLTIIGSNVNTRNHELFNYQNTPDMELWKAIRISCAFPLIFQPYKYNNNYYLDGGNSHYNANYFTKKEETICIILELGERIRHKIDSFEDFIINMLYLPLKSHKFSNYNSINCLELDTQKIIVNFMDFAISLDVKKNIYRFGRKETLLRLPKLLDNLTKLKKDKIPEEKENKNNTREIGTQTD